MTEDFQRQVIELTTVHQGLANIFERDTEMVISGVLFFEAFADGFETIIESFDIELTIPSDYPENLPRVTEIGGRIGTDYEHRNSTGTLCLAVPLEKRRIFFEQPTLLGFVNRLVIPYLYGYSFFRKHGRHPFDEAAHGYEGILRHYLDLFGLRDELAALSVICFLIEFGYRGHHDCPCGSGKKIRTCHGPTLLTLHKTHNQHSLRSDFIAVLELCAVKYQEGKLSIPEKMRTRLFRLIDKFKNTR